MKNFCPQWFAVITCLPFLLSNTNADPFLEKSVVINHQEHGMVVHKQKVIFPVPNGDLLFFCEARIRRGDEEPHHIIMKRSSDKGASWGPWTIIVESKGGMESWNNPTPVLSSANNTLFLFYTLIIRKEGPAYVYYMASEDNGKSWSSPTDITALFRGSDFDNFKWDYHLVGWGNGIELRNKTLIVPIRHSCGIFDSHLERKEVGGILFSVDNGNTWQLGGTHPILLLDGLW